MTLLPNIAVIGKAGSGKDTCAELLAPFHYRRFALADPLKAMLGPDAPRELMQRFGVGVRELHEDAWVNLLLSRIAHGADEYSPVVVTDVRFPNEFYRLKEANFVTLRVEATRNLRVSRLRANGKLGDEAELDHVSETILDHFETDHTVTNEGDREGLAQQLVAILNKERF